MWSYLGAVVTMALGIFGAIAPRRAAQFVSIEPIGGLGLSEVRATYGGLFIALGAVCLVVNTPPVYLTAAAAWIGAAVMRLPSLVVDRGSFPRAIGGAVMELTIGLLLATGAV